MAQGVRRRSLARLGLLAIALAAGGLLRCKGPEPPLEPPQAGTNVVLIVIDTLRPDHLGCYGYGRATSPVIDGLAAQGALFEQAIANSPWTRPSMASMLTGTYPRTTGVAKRRWDALHEDAVTLAEMFQVAGYATYGLTANPNLNTVFGFNQGFDQYGDCAELWPWMDPLAAPSPGAGGNRDRREDADQLTDRAISVLQQHVDGARNHQPFYLQLLYIDPHSPYGPPDRFVHPLNDNPRDTLERYDAEIAFVDHELGRLVRWIQERYPDTLFVITSDHGEGLDDHPGLPESKAHGYNLYDSTLRVPLIFVHPELVLPGRFAGQVQLLDLLPTLAELMSLEVGEVAAGQSLAPILRGQSPPSLPRYVFSETRYREVHKLSAREPGFKLVVNLDHQAYVAGLRPVLDDPQTKESVRQAIQRCGPRELYRLPGAENPVVQGLNRVGTDTAAHQDMETALRRWEAHHALRAPINRDEAREIDESVLEQLEALGYVEPLR